MDKVSEALKKMKRRKAPGIDSIPIEAWIYRGAAVKKGLVDLLQRIWKKGDVPEDWRIGIITSIFKKGDVSKVENYRGISLLCTAYKIYAEIVRRRLETQTERKELLMESQCGFRRGRGTIDNVFVLSHLIQREKIEKKDKIYMVFVDLKAAFDNVDRELLWDILDKKGISKGVTSRLKKIYEETVAVVRTEEGISERFGVRKGVRLKAVS